MSRAIALFELILSIALISLVSAYLLIFTKDIYQYNKNYNDEAAIKLELSSTFIYLQKHGKSELVFNDGSLFYDNDLLLKDVSLFEQNDNNIKICVKKSIEVCQSLEL